jgi:hypothetical protein
MLGLEKEIKSLFTHSLTKFFFLLSFLAWYFLKLLLHHFLKIKSHKEVTKQYELRFSLLFLLDYTVEGSGSGRPKTYPRTRIRAQNTSHATVPLRVPVLRAAWTRDSSCWRTRMTLGRVSAFTSLDTSSLRSLSL